MGVTKKKLVTESRESGNKKGQLGHTHTHCDEGDIPEEDSRLHCHSKALGSWLFLLHINICLSI